MNEQITSMLWVLKYCLKVIYPKYNFYTFLIFLAIKYRMYVNKQLSQRIMDTFAVRTVPHHVMRILLKQHLNENLTVLLHKCLVISREQYIQLSVENLFYSDHGVLWLAVKLSPDTKRKHKKKHNVPKNNDFLNSRFGILTSEIHKKLWANDKNACSLETVRFVPVVGSKMVQENIAFTTENEFYNMASSYGVNDYKDFDISFHPVPSFEYSPKIAACCEVALIVNNYDLTSNFIKELLSNYFEIPKLFTINDVFSIDLTPTMTGKFHYYYSDLVESTGKLYFKCTLLSDTDPPKDATDDGDHMLRPYFIVRGMTKLVLAENVHMLKPKDEYFRLPETEQKNLSFLSLCPTGLKEKFVQIQEAISPFLTGELYELSSSMSSPIIPMLLLTGKTGSGRHLLVKTLAKYNGLSCLQIDCNALQTSTAKQTESKIDSTVQKAKAAAPVIVLLDNFEVFAVDPENNEDCRIMEHFMKTITELYQNYTKHPIIFIAVTERLDLKPNILRIFIEKFHIPRLNVQQRYEMLQWFVSVMQLNIQSQDISETNYKEDPSSLSTYTKDVLQRVAAKTETFLYGDLDTLVHFAMRESYLKQHNSYNQLSTDPNLQVVEEEDFNSALESIRSLQSQHLDAPKIPKVYWEDIGGLDKLKRELLKTIEFPIKYPHLFKNSSLKRSGILLYGPPGCGKTLVAKAVSTELNVSFLSVKGPELLNMYIGQSEENVRNVFQSARASSPCIVFLDELDALAPRRGATGDSGGASDRVVSQLLAEIDGVASGEDADTTSFVFIMGATNRPDLLEQSLLRPGRLDKLIYVGPYSGLREKTAVLKALCRSYKLQPGVNLEEIAAALPEHCTGADLLHVVSTARSAAVRAVVGDLHAGIVKESELSPDCVILGMSELWQGVDTFHPSVSDEELAKYEAMQSQI